MRASGPAARISRLTFRSDTGQFHREEARWHPHPQAADQAQPRRVRDHSLDDRHRSAPCAISADGPEARTAARMLVPE